MDEAQESKIWQWVLATILIIIAVMGIQMFADALVVEDLPEFAQPYFEVFVVFMNTAQITFGIAWGRNLLGFLRNWLATNRKEKYDVNRLGTTWFYYYGMIGTAMATLTAVPIPAPYDAIFKVVWTALTVALDFVSSELNIQPSQT